MAENVSLFKASIFLVGVLADVRLGEFHESTAEVTDYAIETGDVVSDHIVLLPETVEVQIQMSNYDFAGLPLLGLRATTLFQTLRAAQRSRTLFDVLTNHNLYRSMAITSITGDHTAPFRGRLDITIRFKHVSLIQLAFTSLPESQTEGGATGKTASSAVNGGAQDPITAADNRSLLAQITDSLL